MIDSEGDTAIQREKIIPDGYVELIFHYGDFYKTNIAGQWQKQARHLFAAQIKNHFFLENTGRTGIFAVKLQPWTARLFFDIDLSKYTDSIVPLLPNMRQRLKPLIDRLNSELNFEQFSQLFESILEKNISFEQNLGEAAVSLILEKKGAITVQEICKRSKLSERSLERYFKQSIGVSPKFYCRIIRFAYIFELLSEKNASWTDISLQAGFYDQAHFIKNFRAFTGEEPSKYGFNKKNMANFFLQK